jgi:hypothetical protein
MNGGRITSAPALPAGQPVPRVGPPAPTRPPASTLPWEPGTLTVGLGAEVRQFTFGTRSLEGAQRLVVVTDPAMPKDEVHLRQVDGSFLRLINVGSGAP